MLCSILRVPFYVDGNFWSLSVVDRLPKGSDDLNSAHVLWIVEWGFEIMAINLSKFVWIFLWSCVAFLPLISPQDVCRWNWVQFQKNNGQRRILGVIFLEHFSIHILIWPWYFWVSELLQDRLHYMKMSSVSCISLCINFQSRLRTRKKLDWQWIATISILSIFNVCWGMMASLPVGFIWPEAQA